MNSPQRSEPPAAPTPNAAQPGALADYKVGWRSIEQVRRTTRVQVVTFIPLPQKRRNDAPEWQEHITECEPAVAAELAKALAQWLREDRLYIGEAAGLTLPGDVEIRLGDPFANTRVIVFLEKRRLKFGYMVQNVVHSSEALLDPIGAVLLDRIKRAAPGDPAVQRLAFRPLPPPVPTPIPSGIPAETLRQVLAVRPGLRRADLLRVLEEQGGLSSRYDQEFVHPRELNEQGLSVKVRASFVPADTPIRWLNGVGYPVDDLSRTGPVDYRPDDILIRVSAPFVGHRIY